MKTYTIEEYHQWSDPDYFELALLHKNAKIHTYDDIDADTEIINIEYMYCRKSFTNLPLCLKQINIRSLWFDCPYEHIHKSVNLLKKKSQKKVLNKLFPKVPYGCVIMCASSQLKLNI
jgi:hypothetical protein